METAADSSASPPPYEEDRLDAVIQETVEYNLGFAVSEDVLRERLAMAEAAERELREKIYFFANRLQQAHQRINQKKGEAILNAQALRKYVMENQKIKEQYTVVCNEVARLERECALYFHDREVFMEAAEEAEERAQNAERHVKLADDRIKELRSQIEVLNDRMTQLSATNQKMAKELNCLRNTVKELHSHSRSEINLSGQCETDGFSDSRVEELERENKRLRAALEIKYSGAEKRLHESEDSRIEKKGCFSKDRSLLVSSVVAEVLNNATEQEKEEAISKISSSIELCVEEFKSELLGRLETSENKVKLLQVEVASLVQERNKIKSNLEVAEDEVFQVQLLDEQNKELRLLLHSKQQTAEGFSSPLQTKVMSSCSPKSHIRASEPISDNENDCRQPLLPLSQNLL